MVLPFLNEVIEVVTANIGHVYPELVTAGTFIEEVVKAEEDKFISTLDAGINLVEKTIAEAENQGRNYLMGKEVFSLYDTYGFPPELTAEIAKDKGLSIASDDYESEMDKQRERARAGKKFGITLSADIALEAESKIPVSTVFVGYDEFESSAEVDYILDQASGIHMSAATEGQDVAVVINMTPFYGEMGGQLGDTGNMTVDSSLISITNTIWSPFGDLAEGAIIHLGHVVKGTISVGDKVKAEVDIGRRLDIARNHTATHLLQAALCRVLGSHIAQRGSLVAPDRFRFDFSHMKGISKQQLDEIQNLVNEMIRQDLQVRHREVLYEQAKGDIDEGRIIALLGEKYGDVVRVLEIGDPLVSAELCGGTHVKATGEIGLFLVVSESAIGTGLRRIEAVTGREAQTFVRERFEVLEAAAEELRISTSEVPDKIKSLLEQLSAERKRLEELERKLSKNIVEELLEQKEHVNGITIVVANVPSYPLPVLREMGDSLREHLKSAVIVLGTVHDGKPVFIAVVTPDLLGRGLHAGEIIKQVAAVTGGGGGGRAEMAQAGGKDKSKINEALSLVKDLVQNAR